MKIFKKLMALTLTACIVTLAACGGGGDNGGGGGSILTGDDALNIYILKHGFGIEWLTATIEEFKKQDWVKEKYPNLQIGVTYNDLESFAPDKIKGGAGVCPYDLLFSSYLRGLSEYAYELTDVYNATVPGETVKVKDKLSDSMDMIFASVNDEDGSYHYYALPWSGGTTGYVYNHEILTSLGYEVPVTTDEWLATCQAIKANTTDSYDKDYVFIGSNDGYGYWSYSFTPFVTQYMGVQGVKNFYDGIDEFNERSNKIFDNKATLRTMEFLEELYDYDKGLVYPNSDDLEFMSAQLGFMTGNGIFMPNGSWFYNEMTERREDAIAKGRKVYDIRYLQLPVLSAVIETLPDKSVTDDATLQKVIRAIDAGATSYEGVTEADFDRLAEARAVVSEQFEHDVIIPKWSEHKELACDFLKFFATDIATVACYKANGCPTPFWYDVKADTELYNSLSAFEQGRANLLYGNAIYNRNLTPPVTKTPMAMYGGIDFIRRNTQDLYALFSVKNHTVTAQKLWQDTKDYWTEERFQEAVRKAGL
ncbi:MAG: extracellular solute-binding protein [Clostridia bacterium]|nr:extracellular solute-binding protein [Clostridia bacterium]